MDGLIRLIDRLDSIIQWIGKIAAFSVLGMIIITIFDVVSRRFFVLGSTKLQELEWHFHVILFALCFGMAYLKDAHVRIDLVREHRSVKTKLWIELLGCLLFLLPYCSLLIYFTFDFTYQSFLSDEISGSATGLSHRWMIKAMTPLGFGVLALSGLVVALRHALALVLPEEMHARLQTFTYSEFEHMKSAIAKEVTGKTDHA